MSVDSHTLVCQASGAESIDRVETIQSLWSGYGKIMRMHLTGSAYASVIVKHVELPDSATHPRGWSTDLSHRRKVRSYQVESNWYRHWSVRCDEQCRVAQSLALEAGDTEYFLVLEDLDAAGFSRRHSTVTLQQMQSCLHWLAYFHARFMGCRPEGLWQNGTYWHLETRPDELQALDDLSLRQAAAAIDTRLSNARFISLVHGDAKLANFCFSAQDERVAAVDFQYVGAGCGMKDVAYFIGSCLYEDDCERHEQTLLDYYFAILHDALGEYQPDLPCGELEQEWRALYAYAWTDFHRFMKGWSPGHWKLHGYSERLARQVVAEIQRQQYAT